MKINFKESCISVIWNHRAESHFSINKTQYYKLNHFSYVMKKKPHDACYQWTLEVSMN